MSSGLIKRYADLSQRSIVEVEKEWRTLKREFNDSGRKGEYDAIVKKLRERLGLKMKEGRTAYLNGEAEVEILSETPQYVLVRVKDLNEVADLELRNLLTGFGGGVIVQFEHLSAERGGASIIEDTTSISMPSTTTSVPSTMTAKTTTSTVPNTPQTGADPLDGVVVYQGRKAVIIARNNNRATIRFLDTKQTSDVDVTALQIDQPNPVESITGIWNSISNKLSEKAKTRVFESILKFEYSLSFLPRQLSEDIRELAKKDGEHTGSEPADGEDKFKDDSKFAFEIGDWQLIYGTSNKKKQEEEDSEERNPIPDFPKNRPQDEELGGSAEIAGPPAEKGIKPASDADANDVLKAMKSAKEARNKLNKAGSLTGVNLSEYREDYKKFNIAEAANRIEDGEVQGKRGMPFKNNRKHGVGRIDQLNKKFGF